MRWAAESTMTLTFEFHGQLLRLSGAREQQLPVAAPLTLQAALDQLAESRPELAAVLGRCACAIGDRLILRRELLQADKDRKRVVEGKRVSVSVDMGGGRINKKKK